MISAATSDVATSLVNNLGRNRLNWSKEVWGRIDMAVHDEGLRTKVAAKCLPLYPVAPDSVTVPADVLSTAVNGDSSTNSQTLVMDEGSVRCLIEIWVQFALTQQQVESEIRLGTALSLATRAANMLSQAEDLLLFQGKSGLSNKLLERAVRHRGEPADQGLLNQFPSDFLPADQVVPVNPVNQNPTRYGENTFTAVALGYSILQRKAQYGPYALVLHTDVYADAYAPLPSTLIMPADRIKALVTQGFYGTGTLPRLTGLLVSLGGNSMDLVVGTDLTTAFLQEDKDGFYRFRVFERFALRLKDTTAVVRLEFRTGT